MNSQLLRCFLFLSIRCVLHSDAARRVNSGENHVSPTELKSTQLGTAKNLFCASMGDLVCTGPALIMGRINVLLQEEAHKQLLPGRNLLLSFRSGTATFMPSLVKMKIHQGDRGLQQKLRCYLGYPNPTPERPAGIPAVSYSCFLLMCLLGGSR